MKVFFTMAFQQNQIILIGIVALLSAILLILAGSVLNQVLSRARKRKILKNNRDGGADGEQKAKTYLLKNGFTILKEQAHIEKQMIIDGQAQSFTLRADFLVEKDTKTAVVDAKSGIECVNPSNSATRRQLLEYFTCYDVDSVFVYNSIEDKLVRVEFADDTRGSDSNSSRKLSIAWTVLFFIVAQLVIIIAISMLIKR
jgi:hypothetical protein